MQILNHVSLFDTIQDHYIYLNKYWWTVSWPVHQNFRFLTLCPSNQQSPWRRSLGQGQTRNTRIPNRRWCLSETKEKFGNIGDLWVHVSCINDYCLIFLCNIMTWIPRICFWPCDRIYGGRMCYNVYKHLTSFFYDNLEILNGITYEIQSNWVFWTFILSLSTISPLDFVI